MSQPTPFQPGAPKPAAPVVINEVIRVTRDFSEVLDREVEALKTRSARSLDELQVEKARIARIYELQIAELKRQPGALAGASEPSKEELKAATRRLHSAIGVNLRTLEAARDVNRRLMQAVADAAVGEQVQGRGYARAGAGARAVGLARTERVSLALDQRL